MTKYSYKCTKCGHEGDKVTLYAERYNVVCSECGGETVLSFSSLGFAAEVLDTVDRDRNKKTIRDVGDILQDRAKKHKLTDKESSHYVEEKGMTEAVKRGYFDKEKKKCI